VDQKKITVETNIDYSVVNYFLWTSLYTVCPYLLYAWGRFFYRIYFCDLTLIRKNLFCM